MRNIIKPLTLTTLMACSLSTFAINPVEGWYAGLYLGVSLPPSTTFNVVTPFEQLPVADTTLSYSVMGGIGGEVGYRCDHLRGEGQILYNNNPFNTLTINNSIQINGSRTITPTETYPLSMQGQTNTLGLMANAYYDFYTLTQDNVARIVPYAGLGIGYAYVKSNIEFKEDGVPVANGSASANFDSAAAQAIVGSNYFLDDFTTLGLDFRYFSTLKNTQKGPQGVNNLTTRAQFYSINLVFNGAFDVG